MKKIFTACIVSAAFAVIIFFLLLDKEMNQPLPIEKDQLMTISKGTSVASFSKVLEKKGWIANRFWFRAYARLVPEKTVIKVGTYQVLANSSLQNILTLITSAKEHQFNVTIIEGTTFKEVITQLHNQPQLVHSLSS
jgi:UPF0755 protein